MFYFCGFANLQIAYGRSEVSFCSESSLQPTNIAFCEELQKKKVPSGL